MGQLIEIGLADFEENDAAKLSQHFFQNFVLRLCLLIALQVHSYQLVFLFLLLNDELLVLELVLEMQVFVHDLLETQLELPLLLLLLEAALFR